MVFGYCRWGARLEIREERMANWSFIYYTFVFLPSVCLSKINIFFRRWFGSHGFVFLPWKNLSRMHSCGMCDGGPAVSVVLVLSCDLCWAVGHSFESAPGCEQASDGGLWRSHNLGTVSTVHLKLYPSPATIIWKYGWWVRDKHRLIDFFRIPVFPDTYRLGQVPRI